MSDEAPTPLWPVKNLQDAAPLLRRPFTPEAIKWKVQTQYPKGDQGEDPTFGMVVAYIDARLVYERLNLIVPGLWWNETEQVHNGLFRCKLTVGRVTRMDVGEGQGKAGYSDALKRAAVLFGVGVSVYAIPTVKVQAGTGVGKLPVKGPPKKRTLRIEGAEGWLRDRYAAWLETDAGRNFGEPIGHGDALGAQGDLPDAELDDDPERIEDPEPPKKKGKKVKPARVAALAELFAATTRDDVTPDDLKVKLGQMTGQRVTDPDEVMRALKDEQADELEVWIKEQAA